MIGRNALPHRSAVEPFEVPAQGRGPPRCVGQQPNTSKSGGARWSRGLPSLPRLEPLAAGTRRGPQIWRCRGRPGRNGVNLAPFREGPWGGGHGSWGGPTRWISGSVWTATPLVCSVVTWSARRARRREKLECAGGRASRWLGGWVILVVSWRAAAALIGGRRLGPSAVAPPRTSQPRPRLHGSRGFLGFSDLCLKPAKNTLRQLPTLVFSLPASHLSAAAPGSPGRAPCAIACFPGKQTSPPCLAVPVAPDPAAVDALRGAAARWRTASPRPPPIAHAVPQWSW